MQVSPEKDWHEDKDILDPMRGTKKFQSVHIVMVYSTCYYQYASMHGYDKAGRRAVVRKYGSLPFFVRVFIRLRLAILPLEEVEAMVPSGIVADIGCGYGILSHYMAYKDSHRSIIGIEYNSLLVNRANQTVGHKNRVRFMYGNAEMLSLQKYNGVVFCDILHHLSLQGQEQSIIAARASLLLGGRIIIKDIEKEQSIYYYWNLFHDRVLRFSGPTHHRTAREWAVMLSGLGLRIIEERCFRHFLYNHSSIVAERL